MNKTLLNWQKTTDELKDIFIKKYFDCETENYWIGDEIGGCLAVNDYFFNFDRIVEAIKYNATPTQLFNYQDAEIENATDTKYTGEKPMKCNFKTYLKLNN